MKHPELVDGMIAKELADKFMKTTYVYQMNFFEELSVLYGNESNRDRPRRPQLSLLLNDLVLLTRPVSEKLKKIWKICKSRTNI